MNTKSNTGLIISNLHVTVDEKEIVKGVSFNIQPNTIHVLMGPNGSGKSTLASALMGHPNYSITEGDIQLNGEDIVNASPDVRAKNGLFFSMQYPPAVAGLSLSNFLRTAWNALRDEKIPVMEFHKKLQGAMKELNIDPSFTTRNLNEGFSGGEKKRAEILQMMVLEPKYAILDETDSGLDITAISEVMSGIKKIQEAHHTGILLITHNPKVLDVLDADIVHVMREGEIIQSGGMEIAKEIEEKGFN